MYISTNYISYSGERPPTHKRSRLKHDTKLHPAVRVHFISESDQIFLSILTVCLSVLTFSYLFHIYIYKYIYIYIYIYIRRNERMYVPFLMQFLFPLESLFGPSSTLTLSVCLSLSLSLKDLSQFIRSFLNLLICIHLSVHQSITLWICLCEDFSILPHVSYLYLVRYFLILNRFIRG